MSFIVTIISHTFLTHNLPWSSVDFLVCDYNLILQPGTMSLDDDPFHIFIDIHTWAYQLPQRPTVISNLHETYTNLCSTYFTRLYRDDHLPLSPSKHPLIWSSDKDASCQVILYKHLEDCQIKQPFPTWRSSDSPFHGQSASEALFISSVGSKLDLLSSLDCRYQYVLRQEWMVMFHLQCLALQLIPT